MGKKFPRREEVRQSRGQLFMVFVHLDFQGPLLDAEGYLLFVHYFIGNQLPLSLERCIELDDVNQEKA